MEWECMGSSEACVSLCMCVCVFCSFSFLAMRGKGGRGGRGIRCKYIHRVSCERRKFIQRGMYNIRDEDPSKRPL